nr:MAG TPA: hypothetical protein [Caudoviricetes sp.]
MLFKHPAECMGSESILVVNPPMRRGVPAITRKGNLSDARMFAGVILTGRNPAPLSQLLPT